MLGLSNKEGHAVTSDSNYNKGKNSVCLPGHQVGEEVAGVELVITSEL